MALTRARFLETLRALVAGELAPDDWLAWWQQNGQAARKFLDGPSARRLKPNCPASAAGAAHHSQAEAMIILKMANVPARRSVRYHKKFAKFTQSHPPAATAQQQAREGALKPRIDLLKQRFPSLHDCLIRNADKVAAFAPGASDADLAGVEKALRIKLPPSIGEFFKITRHLAVEGLELDLGRLHVHPGGHGEGKRYVCLGDFYWKDDGEQILVEVSAAAAEPKILYYAEGAQPPRVRALAGSWKEFLEQLPGQYLDQMFYYSQGGARVAA
jgi:hypothetical protein